MAPAETHRARIPPAIMAQVNLSDPDLERKTIRKFSFDAKYGKYLKHKTQGSTYLMPQRNTLQECYLWSSNIGIFTCVDLG